MYWETFPRDFIFSKMENQLLPSITQTGLIIKTMQQKIKICQVASFPFQLHKISPAPLKLLQRKIKASITTSQQ